MEWMCMCRTLFPLIITVNIFWLADFLHMHTQTRSCCLKYTEQERCYTENRMYYKEKWTILWMSHYVENERQYIYIQTYTRGTKMMNKRAEEIEKEWLCCKQLVLIMWMVKPNSDTIRTSIIAIAKREPTNLRSLWVSEIRKRRNREKERKREMERNRVKEHSETRWGGNEGNEIFLGHKISPRKAPIIEHLTHIHEKLQTKWNIQKSCVCHLEEKCY